MHLIHVQQAARHIKAQLRECLATLPFQQRIGIIERCVKWINRMTRVVAGSQR
jgi:hypothetical protein